MPACAVPTQDLFFHYMFNNFLHAQVELCVSAMLSAAPPSDSSLEMSAPNPVVKHVSWGSQVPLSVPLSCCQCSLGSLTVWGPGAWPCP